MVDFEESVFRVTAFSSPLLCLRWAWVRTSTNNVAAVLTPARGKRPTASAWAIEAHDVGPGGAMTERLLRASGAIATAATHTHAAHGRETLAKSHTWQVAMQVAAGRALHYMLSSFAGGASESPSPSRTPPRPGTSGRRGVCGGS